MKRYLLFAYASYYPHGASGDFAGDFDTLDEALAFDAFDGHCDLDAFRDVLDTQTGEWVELSTNDAGKTWERLGN
jgi:hypothetical protein